MAAPSSVNSFSTQILRVRVQYSLRRPLTLFHYGISTEILSSQKKVIIRRIAPFIIDAKTGC